MKQPDKDEKSDYIEAEVVTPGETEINNKPEQTSMTVQNASGEINYFAGASQLRLLEEETKKLSAPFEEKLIEVRPDGLLYLPQVFFRQRLNESFGPGQWCLIIKNSTKDKDASKLYLQGVLLVRGNYMAEAVGEAELHVNNPNQSWASVWEAAKSDCIVRCCKDLGIASETWQPEFGRAWQEKYAIKVWRSKTGKQKDGKPGSYQWRKKSVKPFYDESGAATEQPKQVGIVLDLDAISKKINSAKTEQDLQVILDTWPEFVDAGKVLQLYGAKKKQIVPPKTEK